MTKLGDGRLVTRVRSAVRGLLHPPRVRALRPARVRVIGHRGAPRQAPENTRAGFEAALNLGATAVETDVCRTRDGRFVLWHDPDPREMITVARDLAELLGWVANEPAIGSRHRKPISELTYDEFVSHYGYTKRRNAISHMLDGNTRPEVQPEPFESLLACASEDARLEDVFVDIKLRPDQTNDARDLASIIETFEEQAVTKTRFHLLSAEREIVETLQGTETHLPLYGDFEYPRVLDSVRALRLGWVSMGCGQRLWASFYKELCEVLAARDRGELAGVIVWTFNGERRLRALVDAGVDGIITDDPERLRTVLASRLGQ